MSDVDALRAAFRAEAKPQKRQERAKRTRAHALSPTRILIRVLLVPLATLALTLSVYVRTSPYERTDALRHLVAMAGCETARSVGLAPAYRDGIGYHTRNDPDGDGVACGTTSAATQVRGFAEVADSTQVPAMAEPGENGVRDAKFLNP